MLLVKVSGSFQFPSSIRHYVFSARNRATFVWIFVNGVNFSVLPELVLNLSYASHVMYLYVLLLGIWKIVKQKA